MNSDYYDPTPDSDYLQDAIKEIERLEQRLKDAEEVIEIISKMYSHFNVEPEICCSGRDCGCLGKPTNPEYYLDKAIREYQKKYSGDK